MLKLIAERTTKLTDKVFGSIPFCPDLLKCISEYDINHDNATEKVIVFFFT